MLYWRLLLYQSQPITLEIALDVPMLSDADDSEDTYYCYKRSFNKQIFKKILLYHHVTVYSNKFLNRAIFFFIYLSVIASIGCHCAA